MNKWPLDLFGRAPQRELFVPFLAAQPGSTPPQSEDLPAPPGDAGLGDEEELGGEDFNDEDLLEGGLDEESALDPFDDAAADELDTGIEIGADNGESALDEGPERELDIGALDEGIEFGDASDGFSEDDASKPAALSDEDMAIGIATEESAPGQDDAGEEGTGDSGDEDVREEALPELDADEEGEFEEDSLEREMLFASDSSVPAWAPESERWEVTREGGEGLCARALALLEDRLVFAADRRIWTKPKDGGEARCLEGFQSEAELVGLAVSRAGVWAADGECLWLLEGSGLKEHSPRVVLSDVLTIAGASGRVFALVRTPRGARLCALDEVSGEAEGASGELGEEANTMAERGVVLAASAGGKCIALAFGSVCAVSRDFGKSFKHHSLKSVLALAFMGEETGAPLFALIAHPFENKAVLVNVDANAEPVCVGELFGPAEVTWPGAEAGDAEDGDGDDAPGLRDEDGDEGETCAWAAAGLAWDEARKLWWAAGPAGLYALSPVTNNL